MTWTAPEITRDREPYVADERAMLDGWLDFHRQTLLLKCTGLTAEQLKLRAAEPSTLTLLGLVRHMADVERAWFRRTIAGEDLPPIYWSDDDPDGDFDNVDTADVAESFATWRAECDAARKNVAATESLDVTGVRWNGDIVSLRWILAHMIEEYARHNGHADLIRELVDGQVGW